MRNVMVTGASRGLGLGIATNLAANGYNVIAVSRSSTELLDRAIAIAQSEGRGAIHFRSLDLGNIDDIGQVVHELRVEFGSLFGLVNNAGIGTHGILATMHNTDIEKLVRINTVAPIVLSKFVVRNMMADGGGRIVNISSIVAFTGYKALSAYSATKSSMIGFTRSLAREVGSLGICVNAIAPGFLDTEMTGEMSVQERQQVARRSALRKLARVDDVAKSVSFLLSDAGASITGTVLTVDAGSTA